MWNWNRSVIQQWDYGMFHVCCPNVVSKAFFSLTGIQISEKHWVFVSFRIFWPWIWWHLKLWNTGTNCLLSVAWVQKTLLVIQAFRSVGTPNTALTLCITCGLAHTCSYQAHKRTGPPPTHYHLFTHLYAHSNSPFLLWLKTVHASSWFKQAVYLRHHVWGYQSGVLGPARIHGGV